MARNDYFVIAYRILAYLYACLKDGERPNLNYIRAESFEIVESYFEYVIENLYDEGYIKGVMLVPILGKQRGVKMMEDIAITPKGIEFLQSNSAMSRAKEFLKTLKETIPGL